jgi:hypothetical protein
MAPSPKYSTGAGKVRFPWRLSKIKKDDFPTIVDADGKVVCQMVSGTIEDAQRIVESSNRAAAGAGLEEV